MKRLISILICISMVLTAAVFATSCKKESESDGPVAYVLCEKGNTYSLGLAESFKNAYTEKGGSVTMESFPAGETSFSEYFSRAIDVNAEVIFLPNSVAVAADMLRSASDLEVEAPILAGDTWESPVVLEAVKDTGLEVYVTTFFDEGDTGELATKFVSGFKKFVNDNSEYYLMNGETDMVAAVSALGYDAYNVAIAAIRRAAEEKGEEMTSVDVANALWKTDCEGVCGDIVFDKNGDAIKDRAYIKKAKADGSAFEFIKIQSIENSAKQGVNPGYSGDGIAIDNENKRITVGVFEPTTGDDAAGGKQEKLGIIYAHSLDNTVEVNGEDYEIVLCFSDNGSLVEYALATATKLVDEKCVVVIGSYGSGVSLAAAEVFGNASVPSIGASCTNEEVTRGYDYYFRTTVTDPFQGAVMADYAMGIINNKE